MKQYRRAISTFANQTHQSMSNVMYHKQVDFTVVVQHRVSNWKSANAILMTIIQRKPSEYSIRCRKRVKRHPHTYSQAVTRCSRMLEIEGDIFDAIKGPAEATMCLVMSDWGFPLCCAGKCLPSPTSACIWRSSQCDRTRKEGKQTGNTETSSVRRKREHLSAIS